MSFLDYSSNNVGNNMKFLTCECKSSLLCDSGLRATLFLVTRAVDSVSNIANDCPGESEVTKMDPPGS